MRRIAGMLSMMGLALVLVACGGEDDPDPTATPPPTAAGTATTAATQEPTEGTAAMSSPMASPAATPIESAAATPGAATPIASPGMLAMATPVASPVASPMADDAMAVAPTNAEGEVRLLKGTVLLPGTENERYVMSADGCVGLGRYTGVQAGQQVVIEDETGTIVGLTTLAATESQVACSWTFEVEVPASAYYTVSLPLVAEVVVADADVVRTNGDVQVSLP